MKYIIIIVFVVATFCSLWLLEVAHVDLPTISNQEATDLGFAGFITLTLAYIVERITNLILRQIAPSKEQRADVAGKWSAAVSLALCLVWYRPIDLLADYPASILTTGIDALCGVAVLTIGSAGIHHILGIWNLGVSVGKTQLEVKNESLSTNSDTEGAAR